MPQVSKREQIIDAATQLFFAEGFNATGIEKIRDAANVSKKTLYNHFRSKEELILAVLRREDENLRNWLVRSVDELGRDPQRRLLGLFDVYAGWIHSEGFRGCLFTKAACEFADPENKCKAISREAKRLVKQAIKQLVVDTGAPDPDTLTDQINLLVQGAVVQAQVAEDLSAIRVAKDMAAVLIGVGSSPAADSTRPA
ncbi:MAG: TetR/AcrR family transcriptional regulator [Deltaproteobacteria bacterium]|nr:TetR/AcrR family transcriptional regulator [Deltaproteobacteria bacterium]